MADYNTYQEMSKRITTCAGILNHSAIYKQYHAYAIAICKRYTIYYQEAANDGFLRLFQSKREPSKALITTIMIRAAIDQYRKERPVVPIDFIEPVVQETVLDKLSYDDIMKQVEALSPACKSSFTMHVLHGFSHDEIAQHLGISPVTSRANLSDAKRKLRRVYER